MKWAEAGHLKPKKSNSHPAFLVADGNKARSQYRQPFGCRIPLFVQRKPYCTQCCRLGFIVTKRGLTKRGQIYFRGEKEGGTLGQLKPKAQRGTPARTSTVPTQFNTVTHQIPKTKKPQISQPGAFPFHIWCTRRDSNPRPLPSEGSTLSS